ncbi:hypothetical protein [Streptomyces sp. NPDC002851]
MVQSTPWDEISGEVADRIKVMGHAFGSCDTPSSTLARPDAWRCFADDGEVMDPCFTGGPMTEEQHDVLCLVGGSLSKVIRFELNQPLPEEDVSEEDPQTETFAGALKIVLSDGQECFPMGGATSVVGGKRMNFSCPKGYLYGDPSTDSPVWSISYRAGTGTSTLDQVDIAKVFQ